MTAIVVCADVNWISKNEPTFGEKGLLIDASVYSSDRPAQFSRTIGGETNTCPTCPALVTTHCQLSI
jgi:hypothetical protein